MFRQHRLLSEHAENAVSGLGSLKDSYKDSERRKSSNYSNDYRTAPGNFIALSKNAKDPRTQLQVQKSF